MNIPFFRGEYLLMHVDCEDKELVFLLHDYVNPTESILYYYNDLKKKYNDNVVGVEEKS